MVSETLIPRFVPSRFRLIKSSEHGSEHRKKYAHKYGYEYGYKSGGFHLSLPGNSLQQLNY
jgi:hypothetical protein